MYQVNITIPKVLEPEISRLLFSFGVKSISVKTHAGESILTALTSDVRDIKKTFDKDLYVIKKIDEHAYDLEWLKYYRGAAISKTVYIQPAHEQKGPKNYKHVITIDPRYAFGDGCHPTTIMAVRALEFMCARAAYSTMLDAGTGTGILAIAARLLGCTMVEAFDYDRDAVVRAKVNIRLNKQRHIRIFKADARVYKARKQFPLVAANIISAILEEALPALIANTLPGGVLICTGISKCWEKDFEQTMLRFGLQKIKKYQLKGWVCFVMRKENV